MSKQPGLRGKTGIWYRGRGQRVTVTIVSELANCKVIVQTDDGQRHCTDVLTVHIGGKP